MALKLKDEPVTTVQKTGSDYINRDYSKMAEDILKSQEELPESRYSSSNTYQTMNNDMRGLNAQFEVDKYKKQYEKDPYTGLTRKSGYRSGGITSGLNWFTRGGLERRYDNNLCRNGAMCSVYNDVFS